MADRSPLAWAFIRAMQPGGAARNRVRDLDIRLGADLGPFADALAEVADRHLAARLTAADALAEAFEDLNREMPGAEARWWNDVETALAAYRLATEESRG